MYLLIFGVDNQNDGFGRIQNFLDSFSEIEVSWDVNGLKLLFVVLIDFDITDIADILINGTHSVS